MALNPPPPPTQPVVPPPPSPLMGAGAQPPTKPWWKKRGGIAVIVVGVLIALGAIGSMGRGTAEPGASATPAAAEITAAPSESAAPEPTEEATAEPPEEATAEATAEPTEVPTEEPTSEPTVKPTPAAPLLDKKGRGDKVLKFTALEDPAVARITGKGSGNFAVIPYAGTAYDDLLVNEIGSYSGRVYVAPGVDRLKITSNGSWTVQLLPLSSAKHWDGSAALSGKGDSVVVLSGGSFGTTTIKAKGKSNFAVIAYSDSGQYLDLLVNEIGSYKGEVLLPIAEPIVLSIQAVGATWSMSPVQ